MFRKHLSVMMLESKRGKGSKRSLALHLQGAPAEPLSLKRVPGGLCAVSVKNFLKAR